MVSRYIPQWSARTLAISLSGTRYSPNGRGDGRAWDLYADEAVEITSCSSALLSARVTGRTGTYRTGCTSDGDRLSFDCDCPSSAQPCKHIGALAYTVLEDFEDLVDEYDDVYDPDDLFNPDGHHAGGIMDLFGSADAGRGRPAVPGAEPPHGGGQVPGSLHVRAALIEDLADDPGHDAFERLRTLRERLSTFEGLAPIEPPEGLRSTLRPYQRHGLSWLWFLHEYRLGRLADFRRRYAKPIEENGDDDARGRLQRIVRPLLLRRRKREVAPELPEREERLEFAEPGAAQLRGYESLRLKFKKSIERQVERDGIDGARMHILEAMLRLRQAAILPALVFSQFVSVIDEVERRIGPGRTMLRIDGSTPQLRRDGTVISYRLITAGTIEEKMLRLQERMRTLAESIIRSDAGGLAGLTADDLQWLFGE